MGLNGVLRYFLGQKEPICLGTTHFSPAKDRAGLPDPMASGGSSAKASIDKMSLEQRNGYTVVFHFWDVESTPVWGVECFVNALQLGAQLKAPDVQILSNVILNHLTVRL